MFPYLHTESIKLGPIDIYVWGVFVSLGFLIGLGYLIKRYPQDKNVFIDLVLYSLLGSIIGARLFYTFFYAPDLGAGIVDFFKIWEGGLSSFGGFFGAFAAVFGYVKRKKIKFYPIAQKMAYILPLGLAVGRIGCYIINDHPGIKAGIEFLAVKYPDVARYDLGLLLVLLNLGIFIFFVILKKLTPPSPPLKSGARPLFLEYFMLIYGVGRFGLDFLRIGEPRWAGLIPSQYGSILLIAISLYLLVKLNKKQKI